MQFSHQQKIIFLGIALAIAGAIFFVMPRALKVDYNSARADVKPEATSTAVVIPPATVPAVLDTVAYDKKLEQIANNPVVVVKPIPVSAPAKTDTSKTSTVKVVKTPPKPAPVPKPNLYPVKAPYPNAGAILPFKRIVAYYGNFYSKGMGVLGKYPEAEMLQRLQAEVSKWETADPTTPVMPAIDYITVTAQGSPSVGGKYRLRMPDTELDKAVALADKIHGIVILEIQPGLSTFQIEVPLLEKYLKMPQVHLALDPEFSMKSGAKPGTEIGSIDAVDVNFAANYLANLVRVNNLPPKILIVHRFTRPMVTNYKQIKPLPEVQIIMDMDGWGSPAKKIGTYTNVVRPEPIQFTGFKLFYKNDLFPPSTRMLTTAEILSLSPQPLFIQYQ